MFYSNFVRKNVRFLFRKPVPLLIAFAQQSYQMLKE